MNWIFFPVVLQAVHHIFTNSIMEFYEEAFSLTYDLTTTHISKNMWEMFKIIYQVSICAKVFAAVWRKIFSLNLEMSLVSTEGSYSSGFLRRPQNLKQSPTWFVVYLVNVKSCGRLFQIFVTCSECPNFTNYI